MNLIITDAMEERFVNDRRPGAKTEEIRPMRPLIGITCDYDPADPEQILAEGGIRGRGP